MAKGLQEQPILTIAIPTYNRAKYLVRCLVAINEQIEGLENLIEIIVCDNCSTDNTEEVVLDVISRGLKIFYVKNIENKGFDFNISQCLILAKGKYVLAMGDDDFLKKGALASIIDILKNEEYGVVYMSCSDVSDMSVVKSEIKYKVYEEANSIIRRITHNVTFISANIINTKYVKYINFEEFYGSAIAHAPLVLTAITQASKNMFVETPMFNFQPGNSGGFAVKQVFSTNFINILDRYDLKIKDIIIQGILFDFMYTILAIRSKKVDYINEERTKDPFRVNYSKYWRYWTFIYPVDMLPFFLARVYTLIINFCLRPSFVLENLKRKL